MAVLGEAGLEPAETRDLLREGGAIQGWPAAGGLSLAYRVGGGASKTVTRRERRGRETDARAGPRSPLGIRPPGGLRPGLPAAQGMTRNRRELPRRMSRAMAPSVPAAISENSAIDRTFSRFTAVTTSPG